MRCSWVGCLLPTTRYGLSGLAAEDDFDRLGVVADREDGADLFEELGGQIDVVRLAGLLIVKMGMRAKIRAVAGGATLEVHRAHEIALHERFEAVVNRREGDGGQTRFDAGEHFVGGRVIAFFEQNVVDDFSLGSRAQAAIGELLCEGFSVVGGGGHGVFEEASTN